MWLPLMALAIYSGGTWCLWQYAARGAVAPDAPLANAESCPWLSPRDLADINSAVRFSERTSMYDRDICHDVAGRYRNNPWIREVLNVRRSFPDRIEVELAVRRPVAFVRQGRQLYLVDREGVRLPAESQSISSGGYPVIDGVGNRVPAVGSPWNSRSLADSLSLVECLDRVLDGRGAGMRLAGVRVTAGGANVDHMPQMVARTASGMIIDWGSFNQSKTYLYPSAAEKRSELTRVLDEMQEPAAIESIMVRYKGHSLRLRSDWSNNGEIRDAETAGLGNR